jgi:hypothetical protein
MRRSARKGYKGHVELCCVQVAADACKMSLSMLTGLDLDRLKSLIIAVFGAAVTGAGQHGHHHGKGCIYSIGYLSYIIHPLTTVVLCGYQTGTSTPRCLQSCVPTSGCSMCTHRNILYLSGFSL